MEPKYYKLTQDVVNPRADKRYKDNPLMVAVWPKGMRISVQAVYAHDTLPDVMGIKFPDSRWAFHTIPDTDDRYALLMAVAEEIPESFKDYANRVEMSFWSIRLLERLVTEGRTSMAELEGWVAEYDAKEDD